MGFAEDMLGNESLFNGTITFYFIIENFNGDLGILFNIQFSFMSTNAFFDCLLRIGQLISISYWYVFFHDSNVYQASCRVQTIGNLDQGQALLPGRDCRFRSEEKIISAFQECVSGWLQSIIPPG